MMKTSLKSSHAATLAGLACMLASFGAAALTLNTTVRDFCGIGFGVTACPAPFVPHPDFERAIADDRGLFTDVLGPDQKPVVNPLKIFPSSTVTSAATLDEFYRDVPNVNESMTVPLTLTETAPGSGVYQFSSFAFFPIDNELLGNEGQSHNYSFTLELHTNFTYQTGQVFNFTGDDDVWVYINDRQVIDLGGVHGPESAQVMLDTLGLTPGNTYAFDFFFAERHTSGSDLVVSTSIALNPNAVPAPSALALAIAGLLGLAWTRRTRRG